MDRSRLSHFPAGPKVRCALIVAVTYCLGLLLLPHERPGPGVGMPQARALSDVGPAVHEFSRVVGAERCGECHRKEVQSWKETAHFATWSDMHRRDRAKMIASKLGLKKGIKRNDLCRTCHYTSRVDGDRVKPFSGVSCESCHGGARDWIDDHNDYGNPQNLRAMETPEHRRTRRLHCHEAGMLRTDTLYHLAARCYECHTVPQEELVNQGGHKPGSPIELVSWVQGEVRHNYLRSEEAENRANTPAQRRVLFVLGQLLDLEYALRGITKVTVKGRYSRGIVRRAQKAHQRLVGLSERVQITELESLLEEWPVDETGKPKLSRNTALDRAKAVSEAAQRFVQNHDGIALTALDPLLPASSEYVGTPMP